MGEYPSTQTSSDSSSVPSTSQFTSSPLRNRIRVELDAPVSEVWELVGDLSRFPEYSTGLERVEVNQGDDGKCTEYTCYFKPLEEGSDGAVSREVMKWYEPNRGYLSVEVGGTWGGGGTVVCLTLDPIPGGTRLTNEMHFDSEDLQAAKTAIDKALEGRSKFSTWAYTVAVRSLLRTQRRLYESSVRGAEEFASALDAGLADEDPTLEEAEYRLLSEEVRISCTYGMLLCLPRPQRAAYLLADALGLTDGEGGGDPRLQPRGVPSARLASPADAAVRDRQPLRSRRPCQPLPLRPPLDAVVAIGDLYRVDRFAAPSEVWDDLQARFPELLSAD